MYDTQAASCATYPFCWGASPHTLDPPCGPWAGLQQAYPLVARGPGCSKPTPLVARVPGCSKPTPLVARGPGYAKPTPLFEAAVPISHIGLLTAYSTYRLVRFSTHIRLLHSHWTAQSILISHIRPLRAYGFHHLNICDTQAASCATYPFCLGASPHTLDRSEHTDFSH